MVIDPDEQGNCFGTEEDSPDVSCSVSTFPSLTLSSTDIHSSASSPFSRCSFVVSGVIVDRSGDEGEVMILGDVADEKRDDAAGEEYWFSMKVLFSVSY